MQIQAFLGRLVVIRGHHQRGVSAGFLGVLGQFNRFGGRIRARAGDNGHAPFCDLDTQLDDSLVLIMAECRRFTGCTGRHQSVGPLTDLPIDKSLIGIFVNRTIFEGCNQRH